MRYEKYPIAEAMFKINRNEMYLPAIQRKFVWEPEQIVKLFDSIMQGYPIGTFLYWKIQTDAMAKYTFYKFLQKYHERDAYLNEFAPTPELNQSIIGVLDGQQRLSGLYLALQGTYAYKKHGARINNDAAYPERKLYLNLLYTSAVEPDDSSDNMKYEFKFLTEPEAKENDNGHLWYSVRDVLAWKKEPKVDEYHDGLLTTFTGAMKQTVTDKRTEIKQTVRLLHHQLVIM